MKRSQINKAIKATQEYCNKIGWGIPPNPKWDVTDFGLGNFNKYGLVLLNLAEEPEYCEKMMYARKGQVTPAHTHKKKKEDIVVRKGELAVKVWRGRPDNSNGSFSIQVNNEKYKAESGEVIKLKAGERITLLPGTYHEFYPVSDECLIGEVSSFNDDLHDNLFYNEEIGRFTQILEDEPPLAKLVSD